MITCSSPNQIMSSQIVLQLAAIVMSEIDLVDVERNLRHWKISTRMTLLKKLGFWRRRNKKLSTKNCEIGLCYWVHNRLHINTDVSNIYYINNAAYSIRHNQCLLLFSQRLHGSNKLLIMRCSFIQKIKTQGKIVNLYLCDCFPCHNVLQCMVARTLKKEWHWNQ
jgi:hypothetical protein